MRYVFVLLVAIIAPQTPGCPWQRGGAPPRKPPPPQWAEEKEAEKPPQEML